VFEHIFLLRPFSTFRSPVWSNSAGFFSAINPQVGEDLGIDPLLCGGFLFFVRSGSGVVLLSGTADGGRGQAAFSFHLCLPRLVSASVLRLVHSRADHDMLFVSLFFLLLRDDLDVGRGRRSFWIFFERIRFLPTLSGLRLGCGARISQFDRRYLVLMHVSSS